MKEIEFLCDESDNVNELAKKMFIDLEKHNPTSIYYNRLLERPIINWLHIVIKFIVPNTIFIILFKKLIKRKNNFIPIAISCITFSFYTLWNLKNFIVCVIHIYQHYAPDSLRMKCRFEPSCSQYMILAVEKYGALKGLKMGINRLCRCKVGNGGYDFP